MAAAAPPPPNLECGLETRDQIHISPDGVVDLKWSAVPDAASFELEESVPGAGDEFHPRYTGPDLSSVRTGLAAGSHRFRVRAVSSNGETGAWSEPLGIEVEYMPQNRLRLLLMLGGAVVLATITAILHGHFSTRQSPSP